MSRHSEVIQLGASAIGLIAFTFSVVFLAFCL
jgi:hypothetical protein